jgi:hypothetical protein
MVYYLLFFELQNKSYDFSKIQTKSVICFKSNRSGAGHMALFDWGIPIRLDKQRGASD